MNWIKQRRDEIGMRTQEELAAGLQLEGFSVGRASISHWENGRYNPPLENADFRRALAIVLKLSEPEVLRRAGYKTGAIGQSEAAQIGAEIIDHLPPDKQELAVRILETLRAG